MTRSSSRFSRATTSALALLLSAALLFGAVLAQDDTGSDAASDAASDAMSDAGSDAELERRVITIDSSGGTQSGNLRYGPIVYQHPDPYGIVATVSTLTIRGPRAELSAPPDTLLSRAKGERSAAFDGGVRVLRGRLEATGPELVYREATGLGVLEGGVEVTIAPDREGGDPTEIGAELAEFDVDTDRSVSRGGVVLVNGSQRAEADVITYAEEADLGRLDCEGLCTVVREDEETGTLTITAEEIRVLTQGERLWARGDVTVVNGDIATTGDEVVYDDARRIAEVTGSPARSIDEGGGVTLESDRILQDVEFDYVEAIDASQASDVDLAAFLFEEEREAGGAPTP
jgi:lipopolysaccharide export system protein LptA